MLFQRSTASPLRQVEAFCPWLPPILGILAESALAQGGGTQSSHQPPPIEESIIRTSVINVFSFAERPAAGILIILFGIIAVTCFVRKRRKLGFAFSGAALLLFTFRMLVWWFFGAPLEDYEG